MSSYGQTVEVRLYFAKHTLRRLKKFRRRQYTLSKPTNKTPAEFQSMGLFSAHRTAAADSKLSRNQRER